METLPRDERTFRKNMYSYLMDQALDQLGLTVIQYRPHLVQHLDMDTLLFNQTYNNRRSIYFKDYFDELGITFDDAKKYYGKLMEKMRKHFEILGEKQWRIS